MILKEAQRVKTLPETQFDRFSLTVDLRSATINNPDYLSIHRGRTITAVAVYYRRGEDVKAYYRALYKEMPGLFENEPRHLIEWLLVPVEAADDFRGLVITYVPQHMSRLTEVEITGEQSREFVVDRLYAVRTIYTPAKNKYFTELTYEIKTNKRYIASRDTLEQIIHPNALRYMTLSVDGVDMMLSSGVRLYKSHDTKSYTVDSTYLIRYGNPADDQTVVDVLERNRSNWKNVVIVADVTGSMSEQARHLMHWYHGERYNGAVDYFVFFNDGDATKDAKKTVGNTGGIYRVSARRPRNVSVAYRQAVSSGQGGDIPENNMEAVLVAQEACKRCDEIVMIAENTATPRDTALAAQVKRPLRIILYGTNDGVNPYYLELARRTGGSVHTSNADYTRLHDLKPDEEIRICGQVFCLKQGRIREVLID